MHRSNEYGSNASSQTFTYQLLFQTSSHSAITTSKSHVFLSIKDGGQELTLLNQCRMSLQVIWLSEICTGDGLSIQILAWQGEHLMVVEFNWPVVHPLSTSEWSQWQQALTRALFLDWWHKLMQLLGHWLPQTILSRWFYEPESQQL